MTTPRHTSSPRPTSIRALLVLLGVLALALVGAGCGDDEDGGADGGGSDTAADTSTDDGGDDGGAGDGEAGRELFISTCGGCHTLEDADTGGQIGPELTGGAYDADQVASIIENGRGSMPAGLLGGDDRTNVAAYVAEASQ